MIKLNEQFAMKWDSYQWHLLEYRFDDKKDARSTTPRMTYHPTISSVLGIIFERVVGEAEGDVSDLKEKIKEAKELVAAFDIDLAPPVAANNPVVVDLSILNEEEHF